MKLMTFLIAGAVTLGSTHSLAGRHHDHDSYRGVSYSKPDSTYTRTVVVRERVVRHGSSRYRDDRRNDNYARVVSVEPVYRFVTVTSPNYSCVQYDRRPARHTSHTATVLGAVIGGAIGHRIGDAHGDPKVAAVAGGLLGASVGRDIDQRARYAQGMRVDGPCLASDRVERRRELVEYKVSYRYNGRIHHARMDYDPGEWVKLDVTYSPA